MKLQKNPHSCITSKSNSKYYCGLDWGKERTRFYVTDQRENLIKQGWINDSTDLKQLTQFKNIVFLIETNHHWIARYLHNKGFDVRMISGLQSKHFRKALSFNTNKTDKIDAKMLNLFLTKFEKNLPKVEYKSNEKSFLLNWYNETIKNLANLRNQIRSLCDLYNSPVLELFTLIEKRAFQILIELADPEDFSTEIVKKYFPRDLLSKLQKHKQAKKKYFRLDRASELHYIYKLKTLCTRGLELMQLKNDIKNKITKCVEKDSRWKILKTVPRMTTLQGAVFLIGFDKCGYNYKKVAAYIGIAPIVYESGNQKKHYYRWLADKSLQTTTTKWVSSTLSQTESWGYVYFQKRKTAGDKGYTAIRKLAMSWTRKITACVKNNREYIDPDYNPDYYLEKKAAKKTLKKKKLKLIKTA